jgi:2-dehydro-3-deoxy-L-rhamnonate dehydrogenase (NAD+)
MYFSLDGKAAIVTGAARGIGYAIAERLGRAGASLVIADMDEPAAQKAAECLTDDGLKAVAVGVNVATAADAQKMVDRTMQAYGRVDILVNNAGIAGRTAPLWETTDDDWSRVIAVNLTGVFNCCRAAIGPMREQKSGAIVNIASISGKEGNPNMIPYSTSKAGVICLTKALAKEVVGDGIRVNAVAPAVVETEILKQLSQENIDYMCSKIPMGRPGKPDEIAAVVHFLASPDSSFVTGQCYDASGGRATY